jgi:hypothetical protein
MNPTIPEETGLTARTLITTFQQNPGMLALVVFNVFFIIVVFYVATQNRQTNEKLISTLIAQQVETSKMLYNCTPNAPRG